MNRINNILNKLKSSFIQIFQNFDNIAKLIGWIVLISIIIPKAFINFVNYVIPGYMVGVVVGISEYPKLYPGDIIIIKETHILKKGDIGCYIIPSDRCSPNPSISDKGSIVCHDVYDIKVEEKFIYYKFKGYNNKVPDPCYIPKDFVVGKVVFRIPLFGLSVVSFDIFVKSLLYIAKGGYL